MTAIIETTFLNILIIGIGFFLLGFIAGYTYASNISRKKIVVLKKVQKKQCDAIAARMRKESARRREGSTEYKDTHH